MISWTTFAMALVGIACPLLTAAIVLRKRLLQCDAAFGRPMTLRSPLPVVQQILFARLSRALPQHIILSQVPAVRLIAVRRSACLRASRLGLFGMHFDFVVCNSNFEVLVAVVLEDSRLSADKQRRIRRRRVKVCAEAGVRLVRWSSKALPDEAAIQLEFVAYQQAKQLIQGVIERSRLHRGA